MGIVTEGDNSVCGMFEITREDNEPRGNMTIKDLRYLKSQVRVIIDVGITKPSSVFKIM